MTGPHRRFDPSELAEAGVIPPPAAELADALAAARELESLALADDIRPSDGFDDRVMAAIAAAPIPRAVVRPGTAARGGPPAAFLLAVRNAWRVGTSGGRPIAVRAQALAFVLLVVVAVGSLTAAGAIRVAGLLDRDDGPPPSVEPGPTAAPLPSDSALPTVSPSGPPTASPDASETPDPTETAESARTQRPGATARPTATPTPGGTPRPTRTPRPTEAPNAGGTQEPTETPGGSDDHGGGGGLGPD